MAFFMPPGAVNEVVADTSTVERECLQCGAAYEARRVLTSMDQRLVYCAGCGPVYEENVKNPLTQVGDDEEGET